MYMYNTGRGLLYSESSIVAVVCATVVLLLCSQNLQLHMHPTVVTMNDQTSRTA